MHRTLAADDAPAQVLKATAMSELPRQRTRASTAMTVPDTRAVRNVVEPGSTPLLKEVLPKLERDRLRRWRPARTPTVVMVPRQVTTSPTHAIEWGLVHT